MSVDLLAAFKLAAWPTDVELKEFIRANVSAPTPELLKLLDHAQNKASIGEPVNHKKRCTVLSALVTGKTDPALYAALVKALKSADPMLRAALTQPLARSEDPAVATALAGLLAEPALRSLVVQILSSPRSPAAIAPIQKLAKEKGHPARGELFEILLRATGHQAIPLLKEAFPSCKPAERIAALKLLGDPKLVGRDTSGALKLISTQLFDGTEEVARTAVTSFCGLCTEEDWFSTISPILEREQVNLVRPAIEGLRRFSSPRVFVTLEHRLRAGPNPVRFAVLTALEGIGTNDVLGVLVDALSNKQLPVRTRAGEVLAALSKAGKIDLSRTIIWLLRSTDVNVRRQAVELARSVTDPHADLWPKLLLVLRDEDWWVRERLADVLVEMAGNQLTRHVVSYQSEASAIVRRWAVDVLVRLKDPQSLGALVRAAQADADWWVRERALEAIGLLGDPRSHPYLLDLLGKEADIRVACLAALQTLKCAEALTPAVGLLQDSQSDVRYAALLFIEALGGAELAPKLTPLLEDAEPLIRQRARELATRWNVNLAQGVASTRQGLSALERMLAACAEQQGDDLFIAPGRAVFLKRLGRATPLTKQPLTVEQVQTLLLPLLSAPQMRQLDRGEDVDFSYEVKSEGLRFRVNLFREANGVAAVFRIIKGTLPNPADLGLPQKIIDLADLKNGLVLIGGPTGSGKSTTLAVLIDYINRTQDSHIICLEDPIEVIHQQKKSVVTQRELGTHTQSFGNALRATLREDPDVILVGELRDLATIQFAVTAAETGHLVFGTVHTVAADTSIDRLINAFPGPQQDQVRSMLAESLRAVACQYLLRDARGSGRALALEYMLNNDAISSLIRKGKTFQIQSVIATSRQEGMQLMDTDLMRLCKEGRITPDEAYLRARAKKEFEPLVNPEAAAEAAKQPAAAAGPAKAAGQPMGAARPKVPVA